MSSPSLCCGDRLACGGGGPGPAQRAWRAGPACRPEAGAAAGGGRKLRTVVRSGARACDRLVQIAAALETASFWPAHPSIAAPLFPPLLVGSLSAHRRSGDQHCYRAWRLLLEMQAWRSMSTVSDAGCLLPCLPAAPGPCMLLGGHLRISAHRRADRHARRAVGAAAPPPPPVAAMCHHRLLLPPLLARWLSICMHPPDLGRHCLRSSCVQQRCLSSQMTGGR
jgi:hypothetical protein